MENKDLTKEYLNKILDSAIYFKKGNFPDMPLYNQKSIIDAFNAGRESVVENMPELEWREKICRDEHFLEACPFGAYHLIKINHGFHIACNYRHLASYTSLTAAKQAAKEHYKELIKQALGL